MVDALESELAIKRRVRANTVSSTGSTPALIWDTTAESVTYSETGTPDRLYSDSFLHRGASHGEYRPLLQSVSTNELISSSDSELTDDTLFVSPEDSGNSEATVTMVDDAKNTHIAAIEEASMVMEDDFRPMLEDFASYIDTTIRECVTRTNCLKTSLQKAQVYLRTYHQAWYKTDYENRTVAVKNELLEFSRKAQQHLISGNGGQPPPTAPDPALATRRARVDDNLDDAIDEMVKLSVRHDELIVESPSTDLEWWTLNELWTNADNATKACLTEA